MKSLTDQLKQAYEALAFANLGERSGQSAMLDALNGEHAMSPPPVSMAPASRWIALGVGDHLPPPLMAYAIGACRRMGADLLLITRDANTVRFLLDPYLDELADIRCETEAVAGRSEVLRMLARRSGVLFAVSGTADDPVASLIDGRRGLLSGKSPGPVVVVSPEPRKKVPANRRAHLAAAH
jgi:hypothetical protein